MKGCITMHLKRKIVKTFAVLLSAAVLGLFGTAEYYSSRLPEVLTTEAGEALEIAEYPEITCGSVQGETAAFSETLPTARHVTLSLFGAIPVKSVEIREEEAPTLVAAGIPFGIKLLMDGVMVTELSDVESPSAAKSAVLRRTQAFRWGTSYASRTTSP